MVTLFRTDRPVKPGARRFGRGILRSLPVIRVDRTADDAAWWAAESAAAEDRHFDELAEEAAMQAAVEAGSY